MAPQYGYDVSDQGGVQPGWYPDPEGRFEHRYHNGVAWTRDVAMNGRRYVDDGSAPMGGGPSSTAGRGGTAALVLGMVAVTLAWLPLLFVVGIGLGIAALATGLSVRRRAGEGTAHTFATIGAVAGGASLALSAVGVWFTVVVYRAVDAYQNPARHTTEVVQCTTDGAAATFVGRISNLDDERADFTVRLEFDRPGSSRTLRSVAHEVDDVDPGETREFTVRRELSADDVDCRIAGVDGPLPFGLDLD